MTRVFAISGNVCAGKSTVGGLLEMYEDVEVLEVGNAARSEYHNSGSTLSLSQFASRMKEIHGMEWPINSMTRDISDLVRKGTDVAVVGIRAPDEVEFIRRRVDAEIISLAVWAEYKTRLQRYMNRNRADDDETEAQFRIRNRREREWGIPEVRKQADIVLVNESDPESLREDVNTIYYGDNVEDVQRDISPAVNNLTGEYFA